MDKAIGMFDLHGFCLLVQHVIATSCLLYADTVPVSNLSKLVMHSYYVIYFLCIRSTGQSDSIKIASRAFKSRSCIAPE